MVVFSFVCITDLTCLFTWNLETYFQIFFGFDYENTSIILCRLMSFLQFFGLQSSALLLSFIPVDRFFSIISKPGSFITKLPFGSPRTSFIWSLSIIAFVFLLNSHILILNGTFQYSNQTILNETQISAEFECYFYSSLPQFLVVWDTVHIVIYSVIPTLWMSVFNFLIILKTLHLAKNLNRNNSQSIKLFKKRKKMTASLVIITFLFMIISFPDSIYFAFFRSDDLIRLGQLLDCILFLQHSTLFFSLYFSNIYFRKAVSRFFKQAHQK